MRIEYKKLSAVDCLPVYQYICIYAGSLHVLCMLHFISTPHCIYVFCVDLRTNSDYFHIQH